jgi:hypothetical protein
MVANDGLFSKVFFLPQSALRHRGEREMDYLEKELDY